MSKMQAYKGHGNVSGGLFKETKEVVVSCRTSFVTLFAHYHEPLVCQRTDVGYGGDSRFAVTAAKGKATSLVIESPAPMLLNLSISEARSLHRVLGALLEGEEES